MKLTYTFIIFILIGISNAFGQSETAIKYYDQKKYNEALQEWNKLIAEGAKGEELYYNIANTHYRLQHYPEAILFYNKALKWNPNCGDCKLNLKIAEKAAGIDSFELPEFILTKIFHTILLSLQPMSWLIISIVLFSIFLFAFIFKKDSNLLQEYKSILQFILFLGFVCLLLARQRDHIKHSTDEVVLMKASGLHLSPDAGSESKQELIPGQVLKISDQLSGWIKVQTKEFDFGWVEESKVTSVEL